MKKAKFIFWLLLIAIAALFVYQNPEFFQAKHRLSLKLLFIDPIYSPELATLVYFAVAFVVGFLIAFILKVTSQMKARKTMKEMSAAIVAKQKEIDQLRREKRMPAASPTAESPAIASEQTKPGQTAPPPEAEKDA